MIGVKRSEVIMIGVVIHHMWLVFGVHAGLMPWWEQWADC